MHTKTLVLWWFDTNWKKKGAAEHLVCSIDFENNTVKTVTTYTIPQGLNCIEVKRKSDITDYIGVLKTVGFVCEG